MKGLNVLFAVSVARPDHLRMRSDAQRPRATVIPFA